AGKAAVGRTLAGRRTHDRGRHPPVHHAGALRCRLSRTLQVQPAAHRRLSRAHRLPRADDGHSRSRGHRPPRPHQAPLLREPPEHQSDRRGATGAAAAVSGVDGNLTPAGATSSQDFHERGRHAMASQDKRGTGSTTSTGAPAPSDRNSLTIGPDGPIVLHDVHFLEQMAHFNREKVPERQPHAKGAGAFGVFETTADVSRYTKAALFQPGAKTELLIRFSTVAGEMGSPDTWRDVRGFSIKFYTSEGNYDLVGNNTPIFFVRDPMKFPHFIRSQKRLPDSGLRDNHMQWDFWTNNPESAHQVTYLMGPRGLPRT